MRCWERADEFYPMKVRVLVIASPSGEVPVGAKEFLKSEKSVLRKGDVIIIDETISMTKAYESAGTFFKFIELKRYGSDELKKHENIALPSDWPENFLTPVDYFNGMWTFYYEVLTESPPLNLQFCIFDLVPAQTETCAPQVKLDEQSTVHIDEAAVKAAGPKKVKTAKPKKQTRSKDEEDSAELVASALKEFSPWTVQAPFREDAQMEEFINDILYKQMDLRQKVGQMIMIHHGPGAQGPDGPGKSYITHEMLRDSGFGLLKSRVKSNDPKDWVARVEELQGKFWDEGRIPAMWFIEAIHGFSTSAWGTIMPHNMGLGCTDDDFLMTKVGNVTARELTATGYDATFGICVAVPKSNRWGRVYEGFSQDPERAARLAHHMILGLQGDPKRGQYDWNGFMSEGKIVASAKHFIGDGATGGGVDGGNTDIGKDELKTNGLPYVAAIEAGVQAMMVNKGSYKGQRVHGSYELLTDLVKKEWKFDGFLYTDWFGYLEVDGCNPTSCPKAINAGMDAFMIPFWWAGQGMAENTVKQVQQGVIPEWRIDDAVRRILRVKYRNHLIPGQPTNQKARPSNRTLAGKSRGFPGGMGSYEHRLVGQEAVRKSLIMLKNKNNVLPLRRSAKILLAGNGVDNILLQCGSWTVTWQGFVEENSDKPGKDYRSKTGSDDYPVKYTDRTLPNDWFKQNGASSVLDGFNQIVQKNGGKVVAVSYTHLTLPTIYSV
eukprot:TRINITY_DN32294_c0_g1_i1.p1 TRINITY_DN32294_c0_g1~~TRINITY_DN32294_c0_g1_i1.p1  ORF type:complete len:719 (+),score=100.35 TRINITY_DN32294_c0_g1_i1:291-2447(+)